MRREDAVRMRHMLDAAQEAASFASGRSRQDLDRDRMLTFALVRAIEIIGEAASKVSPETRAEHPSLPWPAIVNMRNRVIHAYFDVDVDLVWDTISIDVPLLIAKLHDILS